MSISSPVTGGATSVADTFAARTIVERWATEGIDVGRYFAGLRDVELRRCDDTGYRFFYPASLAGQAQFYEDLYAESANHEGLDYRTWSEDYQFALDRVVSGERLLDVGCGNGYFLARAAERADATGLDGNPYAQRTCAGKGLTVRLGMIQDHADEMAGSIDTLCAFQILEHVYEVRSFLEAAAKIVKPGGRLIITVPNNEPYFWGYDKYDTWNTPPHHIGLWDRRSLEAAGRHFGLKSVEHAYLDQSRKLLPLAYHHARYLVGVTGPTRQHALAEWAKIAVAASVTLPASVLTKLRRGGVTARGSVAMVFEKSN